MFFNNLQIILPLSLTCFTNLLIDCVPISNGFSLKFNPISPKEPVKPKSFGTLFAKIPQETPSAVRRGEVLSKAIFTHPLELANGCTNQIAKMLYPVKVTLGVANSTRTGDGENVNFINLPIIKQPSDSYNVLVATAPKNVKLDKKSDALPTVLYVVFPSGNETNETNYINLPTIFFVKQSNGNTDLNKKEKDLPLFIVDNNRTVTGLRSKEVSKFVRFKNKFRSLYNNDVPRN